MTLHQAWFGATYYDAKRGRDGSMRLAGSCAIELFGNDLEGPLSERVQATAQRHGLTVNAIIHGAWALLQSHYEVSGEKKGRNEH